MVRRPEWEECYSGAEFHGHVDHGGDDGGGVEAVPVGEPFVNNQEVHITKQHQHEDELRYELEEEVDIIFAVEAVAAFQEDSEGHMQYTDDN